MIATFVSHRNDCHFCQASHRAAAAHHLEGNYDLVDAVKRDFQTAPVSSKLKALLAIAAKVQESGRQVTRDRCRERPRRRGERHRDPRRSAHRRRVLHVQPLRRRSGDAHAPRRRRLRPDGTAHGQGRICPPQRVARAALYLPDVEANPQPGIYRDLIASARERNAEYSKIWDLFAFQQTFTIHLARFTQGVLRQPATISPGLRELDRRLHLVSERVRVLHAGACRSGQRAARRRDAGVGGATRSRTGADRREDQAAAAIRRQDDTARCPRRTRTISMHFAPPAGTTRRSTTPSRPARSSISTTAGSPPRAFR